MVEGAASSPGCPAGGGDAVVALPQIFAAIANGAFSSTEKRYLRRRAVEVAAAGCRGSGSELLTLHEECFSTAAELCGSVVGLARLRRLLVNGGHEQVSRRLSALAKARRAVAHPDVRLPSDIAAALRDLAPGCLALGGGAPSCDGSGDDGPGLQCAAEAVQVVHGSITPGLDIVDWFDHEYTFGSADPAEVQPGAWAGGDRVVPGVQRVEAAAQTSPDDLGFLVVQNPENLVHIVHGLAMAELLPEVQRLLREPLPEHSSAAGDCHLQEWPDDFGDFGLDPQVASQQCGLVRELLARSQCALDALLVLGAEVAPQQGGDEDEKGDDVRRADAVRREHREPESPGDVGVEPAAHAAKAGRRRRGRPTHISFDGGLLYGQCQRCGECVAALTGRASSHTVAGAVARGLRAVAARLEPSTRAEVKVRATAVSVLVAGPTAAVLQIVLERLAMSMLVDGLEPKMVRPPDQVECPPGSACVLGQAPELRSDVA